MIPEEVQAFIRSVKEGGEAAPRALAPSTPRRRRTTDATRALGEALVPALADPEIAKKVAELQKRLDAEHAAGRRAAAEEAAGAAGARRDEVRALAARRAKAAQALA